MRITSLFGVLLGSMLLLSPLQTSAGETRAEIVVIANKAVPTSRISRSDLRPIFQTKKDTWPDGTPARPINLPDNSPIRHAFDSAVLGLDPDRVARYWIDRKIRGGERPPPTVSSSALVVKLVSKTAGALGYVEASAVDGSVKVVAKIVDGQVVAP
jgi:ABC-type phosphate transport system substrate-binding protein